VPLSTHPIGVTHLDGIVDVYDPAMCCSTGVCGPGVDPALLQFAGDLRWLEARRVTVARHGLAQEMVGHKARPFTSASSLRSARYAQRDGARGGKTHHASATR
jgi:hypothetical protein